MIHEDQLSLPTPKLLNVYPSIISSLCWKPPSLRVVKALLLGAVLIATNPKSLPILDPLNVTYVFPPLKLVRSSGSPALWNFTMMSPSVTVFFCCAGRWADPFSLVAHKLRFWERSLNYYTDDILPSVSFVFFGNAYDVELKHLDRSSNFLIFSLLFSSSCLYALISRYAQPHPPIHILSFSVLLL